MASECSFDALFPNADTDYKNFAINKSFNFIKNNIYNVKNKSNIKIEAFEYLKEILKKSNNISKKYIDRYMERINFGFNIEPMEKDIEKIVILKENILLLDNSLSLNNDIIGIIEKMYDSLINSYENNISIYDEIIGNFSDSDNKNDLIITDIYDQSYDQPYIEILATKLKPRDRRINFLYSVKRKSSQDEYEKFKEYMRLELTSELDFDKIIIPY
jgi:hypothetical protein